MAVHKDLSKSYIDSIAEVALSSLSSIRAYETATNGTISVRNADGTRTVIGVGAGSDSTGASVGIAQFVGDTEPPSAPTGVSFYAVDGAITGVWDGTLEDGVPSDLSYVAFRADGETFGTLKIAGSTSSDAFEVGETYSCDAMAVDLQGNVSDPCDAVDVTVRDVSAEAATAAANAQSAADEAKSAADEAQEAADSLASEITDVQTTVTDLSTTVSGVAETAEAAYSKATTVETSLDGFIATVESTYATSDELLEQYTELSATIEGVSSTASSAYSTATEALEDASTAIQTAESIYTKVQENYTTTEDLESLLGNYVKDSTLSATLSKYSTTEQTAELISSTVSESLYTTDEDGNETAIYATTSYVEQTAEEIYSQITQEVADAESDLTAAYTSAISQSATDVLTEISETYATTEDVDYYSTLIRESSGGLEISRLVNGACYPSKAVMDWEGLKIYTDEAGDGSTANSSPSWKLGLSIDSDSVDIMDGDTTTLASFGTTTTIGDMASGAYLSIDSDSIDIVDEDDYLVAQFTGDEITLGATSKASVVLNSSSLSFYYTNRSSVAALKFGYLSDSAYSGVGLSYTGNLLISSDSHISLDGVDNVLRPPFIVGRKSDSSTATTSLTAGTITQIALDEDYSQVPSFSGMTIYSKLVCCSYYYASWYEVSASVYIQPSSTSVTRVSVFVYAGTSTTFSNMTEVAAAHMHVNGTSAVTVSIPSTVVYAGDFGAAGDVLYFALAVRSNGDSATYYDGNAMTFLYVKHLGY